MKIAARDLRVSPKSQEKEFVLESEEEEEDQFDKNRFHSNERE